MGPPLIILCRRTTGPGPTLRSIEHEPGLLHRDADIPLRSRSAPLGRHHLGHPVSDELEWLKSREGVTVVVVS